MLGPQNWHEVNAQQELTSIILGPGRQLREVRKALVRDSQV